MSQPTLVVWCAEPGCARYLEEETVPAFETHDRRIVCEFEVDETCPECGALRKAMR